jgi:hypothetical protein
MQKLTVRYAAGSDELAQLVRRDQDMVAETDRLPRAVLVVGKSCEIEPRGDQTATLHDLRCRPRCYLASARLKRRMNVQEGVTFAIPTVQLAS